MINLIFIYYLIVHEHIVSGAVQKSVSSLMNLGHSFYCMFSNNKALYGAEMGQCHIDFKGYTQWPLMGAIYFKMERNHDEEYF